MAQKWDDILIFLSDQHSASEMGCMGNPIVKTPHLDRLAGEGVLFEQAYTSCPLCIPARMSLLTGRLPSKINQFDNRGSIHSDQPTFLHSLSLAGYETVLCGRMHFEGMDQRHGFTRRIAGDITPTHIGSTADVFAERGEYAKTFAAAGSIHIIGGGNSPVLEYDRYVVEAALDYLARDHGKPQCLVVGTYAPHFPYVAPPELYEYYRDRVELPGTADESVNPIHPVHGKRQQDKSEDIVRAARAAYYGLVEFTDQCVGRVHDAWREYLRRTGREGVFAYLSDHGDHAGDRGFYGKQSFYEASSHIPFLFQGKGVKPGIRISSPVSLMDLGPTLCDLTGGEAVPDQDGVSLAESLLKGKEDRERLVQAEWVNGAFSKEEDRRFGKMLRKGEWKFITYADYPHDDELYRLRDDPGEVRPLGNRYPEIAASFREEAYRNLDVGALMRAHNVKARNYEMMGRWGRAHGTDKTDYAGERWACTEEGKALPEDFLCTRVPLPEMFRKT